MNLLELINESAPVKNWQENLLKVKHQLLLGINETLKNLMMAGTLLSKRQKILILMPNLYSAHKLQEALAEVILSDLIHVFDVDELLAAEVSVASPESMATRIEALDFLLSEDFGIIIVPTNGARRFLPSPKLWQESHQEFNLGEEFELDKLANNLLQMGYRRSAMVTTPGEFSIRGSIVDLYPLNTVYPYRIEFFDTEIDSIRTFDADTQRSRQKFSHLSLSPATDLIFTQQEVQLAIKKIEDQLQKRLATLKEPEDRRNLENNFNQVLENLASGIITSEDYLYADYLYQNKSSIFDYLPPEALVFIDDFAKIMETEQTIEEDELNFQTQKLAEGKVFSEQKFGSPVRENLSNLKQHQTFFSLFQRGLSNLPFEQIEHFNVREMQNFFAQMDLLKVESDRWSKLSDTVVVYVPDADRMRSVEALFRDFGLKPIITKEDQLQEGKLQLVQGNLTTGFEWLDQHLVVLSEQEIFRTVGKRKRARPQNISNAERLKSYNELIPGDYVVHVNHGVGRFLGIETIEMAGIHQDYLALSFQNDDKIYVPVTKINLISKYTGSGDTAPKLNKLSDVRWKKTRSKVAKQIEDIADDLIDLYAAREAEKGFAFSPDTQLQKEFEDAFPYVETEDQLRSIEEIKKDMERDRPMDRLLVGDVGFGKTEVALRAAFKAIMDHKQVAFLVPTTILAQQHFDTMTQRFADFPVNFAQLSRFKTKKEQEQTITALKRGQIDLVVGTHRLLSKDVEFGDLGLLIVDEEQRFGVKHKERLKQLRNQVDVLTLTATPIPRTLHISMMGVRDLSVIETPPENRYPVQTYVMENNRGAIREAILREIDRTGQVFYLYNRVETIESKAHELEQLIPEARIGIAHGQMTEIQLENVLFDFIEGKFDVLVATTIIETGVDIPNANTLFVENADKMGLATLYQLRGRVGRSNRIAYAYFMYMPDKILSEVSEKRLEAIKNFTELGSGFKVAMRDLSIRGAGNILGSEQHGFIDAVGFDLYSEMLEQAVRKRQGTLKKILRTNVEIDLGIDAYLPDSYIGDERQKIEIYKRIRQLDSKQMYDDLMAELIDRFGEFPTQVALLLLVGLLKMDSDLALIETIKRVENVREDKLKLILSTEGRKTYSMEQIFQALSNTKLEASLEEEQAKMIITLAVPHEMKAAGYLQELINFTGALAQHNPTVTAKN